MSARLCRICGGAIKALLLGRRVYCLNCLRISAEWQKGGAQ